MKHQHGLAGYCCLLAKSCSSPTSLYKAGKARPAWTFYRTHANATAPATGPIQAASRTQGQDSSVSLSKRFEHVPSFSSFLTDTHSRQHTYLRISLTERCNLRCTYCMPEAGVPLSPQTTQLTTPEILLLSSLFVSQGINKIRLTGGEPTVRKDIVPLMQQLGDLRSKGLRELCITSNGIVLKNKLESMHKAGLTAVNLSLDTLDPGLFMIMTRRRGFERVIETMERILEMNRLGANIDLKINVVVMKGVNDSEILRFVELGKDKNLEVRFIEYMPFDENQWARNKMVTYQDMLHIIQQKYPELEKAADRKGDTSKKYRVPGFAGRIGFITSMTENFCASCNRLRITSDGNLKVCLFGNTEISLRDLIRKENHGQPIDEAALAAMKNSHLTDDGSIYIGDQERKNELLQAIGLAVGRKKAQHAGMGVLEKTKNRPMILIDKLIPTKTRRPLSQPSILGYSRSPIADLSVLQAPFQLKTLRLFSTTDRLCSIEEESGIEDKSSEDSPSTIMDQDEASSAQAETQHDATPTATAIPPIDSGVNQDHDPNSFNEVLQVVSQLESELGFLRSQVQALVSQHHDDSRSASRMNDQIKRYEKFINSTRNETLTHLDQRSAVHMVSVSNKPVTKRIATAIGKISLASTTIDAIASHALKKGDVLSVARIAAIQAVKKTSDLIPLCHPGLSVEGVKVDIGLLRAGREQKPSKGQDPLLQWINRPSPSKSYLKMAVTVESSGKTGIEMEALTGVTAGLLTVYDMCKSVDKGPVIGVELWHKAGGKSGQWSNIKVRDDS